MVRYRRYLIALAVVIVLVGAYAAAGFLAVPYFARKYAQGFVHDHYGRTLSIGEIRFNPFTLNLDVNRLSLPDADGKPMLAFERLHVHLQLATLWRLGPSFGEIVLTRPLAHVVVRPGGVLNLADLGKGFAPEKPAAAKKPSEPLRLYIGRLQVTSGTATFEDRTRATPFRADFTPIAFELRDFSTRGSTGNGYGLSAASPEGERLNWSGTVHLAPLSSQGVFEITDLKARTLWSYMRQSLPFEIDSGVIGLKGDYGIASRGGPLALDLNVRNTTVTGLGVKPAGGAEHYIDVARIEVDDTRVDLIQHSVNIGKLALSGGDIKVWLDQQRRLNLLDLLGHAPPAGTGAPPQSQSADPPPTPAATARPASATPGGKAAATIWKVSVPDISASAFKVSAEDRGVTPAATLLLAPLNVRVKGFNTAPDNTLDVTVDSGVNDAGKITGQGRVTARTGAVTAHLETEKLPLTALQPYIAHYTSMTLLKGSLGAKLDVERQADGALAVKCNTSIIDLRTVDDALKQDFIKWNDLRIKDISYRSSPQSLRVGAVTALEPYVRMIVEPDRTINIVRILKPPGSAAARGGGPTDQASTTATGITATPDAAPAPTRTATKSSSRQRRSHVRTAPVPAGPVTPFPVSIGTVTLVNGSANYADLWIKPSFAIGIQSLGGTVKGLSSDPRSRARVDLKGKVDRYSPIQIGGEVNLLSAALYTDIKMSFQDLDLTVVNPYSGHFVGYKIAKGKLSVDVTYEVDQRQLNASQHFVVDQLELGDRVESPDAVHLPLKIAVALLKDRNGVIDLNLPMTGSLDDPKFRIGPIVWKMFVNLIVKAATAPFALLGHLFGGGNEHLNVVEFAAGGAELDKPGKDQLAALAKSLKERPQLKLEVPIVYSAELDRPQIADARLRAELLARERNTREGKKHPDTAGELALADPQKHFKLLVDQYRADLGKDAALPPTAVAVQQAGRKENPPYDEAINDLNAALINHIPVTDDDLEALGKERASAIQQALVSEGQVEAARVFIVNRTLAAAAASPPADIASQTRTSSSALASPQTSTAANLPTGAADGSQADSPGEPRSPPPGPQASGKVKVELALR